MIYNYMNLIVMSISQCGVTTLWKSIYILTISFYKVLQLIKLTNVMKSGGNDTKWHEGASGTVLMS